MAGPGSARAQRDEGLSRLREEATRLREEVAALRTQASRARHDAVETDMVRDDRMALLREVNEKLVVATIHAQTMSETVQQSNRDKEQFLAMLAHELRNPLAPIVSALAILRRITAAHPQLPRIHDVLQRQVDQLTRLLNELLEVSRVTSGKIVLKMRPIETSEFMQDAVEASRPLIDSRGQKLTLDLPTPSLMVDGDPIRLAQIFGNLLNNASKYTPEGGTIVFSARQEGDAVALRVEDDGTGIAAQTLPRIFELFVQEGRSLDRSQGGLGIGLSVVRTLVELHGGSIEASSPGMDQGSAFVVKFPLVRNISATPVATGAAEMESPGESYRIVLVEDNVDANDSMKSVLEMMGHEVFSAFDGTSGVALVCESKPRFVLCDIGLPGLDGYQVIARLREVVIPMPVMIALTGYGQAEDRKRALAAGFDHHFSKPVDIEALLRLLAAEGRRARPGHA
jgi:signal transduction histidine kinase/CheY-like chemotaxis protein